MRCGGGGRGLRDYMSRCRVPWLSLARARGWRGRACVRLRRQEGDDDDDDDDGGDDDAADDDEDDDD
eukprot:8524062-Pyramimonas_sp.AAC.1